MAVQTDKLRRMFDADSKIMLETLSTLVTDMSDVPVGQDLVDRAFRAAHSIKSEAGFLQLSGVAGAAHALEESLSRMRGEGDATEQAQLSRELEELTEEISRYRVEQEAASPARSEPTPHEVQPLGPAEMGMLREARGRSERLYRVGIRFTCEPGFIYPRAFLVVNNLEVECGVVQTVPPLEALKDGGSESMSILVTSSGDEELLRRLLNVDEIEISDISELAFQEAESLAEAPITEADELAAGSLRMMSGSREEILLYADEVHHLVGKVTAVVGKESDEETRLHADRLRAYSRILKERVDRTARVQLLDVLRELRPRAIAHAERNGKRLRIEVSGTGAVVFTALADTLTDAILHLVRNSIDHGIETIQARASRGRPPAGTIRIAADRLGDTVRVRVSDDGVGIDEEALRRKTGDTERSLLDILATPGFSMKSRPDQSSGRGVGLDSVVHTIRELLSGGIELRSELNRGTVLNISVPAASRLVNVLVVETPDGPAALPAALVVEQQKLNLRRFKRDSFGGRYYDFRGQVLALLTAFGKSPSDEAIDEKSIGMVVRCGERNAVLVCSRVLSAEAVVRDDIRRRKIYSRTLGRDVPYVFPPRFVLPK